VNAAAVEREAALGPFAAHILILVFGHTAIHPMIAGAPCSLSYLGTFDKI
jgi:hypothetical protein